MSAPVDDFVKGRSLSRAEARLTDERLDLLDRRLVDKSRAGVHILFEKRPSKIIGSPMERDLPGFFALGEPRGLYVLEVVEIETRRGQVRKGSSHDP